MPGGAVESFDKLDEASSKRVEQLDVAFENEPITIGLRNDLQKAKDDKNKDPANIERHRQLVDVRESTHDNVVQETCRIEKLQYPQGGYAARRDHAIEAKNKEVQSSQGMKAGAETM